MAYNFIEMTLTDFIEYLQIFLLKLWAGKHKLTLSASKMCINGKWGELLWGIKGSEVNHAWYELFSEIF